MDLRSFEVPTQLRHALVMICLLGEFRLTFRQQVVPLRPGSKSALLLIRLALTSHEGLSSAELMDLLWPGRNLALARQSLSSLVHQLHVCSQKHLSGHNLIRSYSGHYAIDRSSGVCMDTEYFDTLLARGDELHGNGEIESGIACWENALGLYRGDLVDDGAIETVIERERLRASFLKILARLADYAYSQGDNTKALAYIYRLLRHDPSREDAHRKAMRCYMRLGLRSQAFRQYELCRQSLQELFGCMPEPATENLLQLMKLDPMSVY
jgi:DNA-binding SARP family transcriptional activator